MRLIDAEELERLFYDQVESGATDLFDAFDDALQDAQTVDAVAVVRCLDCKHAEPYKRTDGATGYYCHCKYNVFEYGDRRKYTPVRESDDYCSYGEREGSREDI